MNRIVLAMEEGLLQPIWEAKKANAVHNHYMQDSTTRHCDKGSIEANKGRVTIHYEYKMPACDINLN